MNKSLEAASLYCYGDREKFIKYLDKAVEKDRKQGEYYFNLYVNRIFQEMDRHPNTLFFRETAEKLLKKG